MAVTLNLTPHFVLLRWKNGTFSIVKDYADMLTVWDSPRYDVIGFFNSYKSAQTARRIVRQSRALHNHAA